MPNYLLPLVLIAIVIITAQSWASSGGGQERRMPPLRTERFIQFFNERVNHKPIITESPKNQTVVYGHGCKFTCKYLSDSHFHLEWLVTYNNSRNKTTIINPAFVGTLQLYNVTFEDEGRYTCVASNSLGHSHKSAYLKVVPGNNQEDTQEIAYCSSRVVMKQAGDMVYTKGAEQKIGVYDTNITEIAPCFRKKLLRWMWIVKPAGKTVRFKCPAKGNPAPNITWYKDGKTPISRNFGIIRTARWSITLKDLDVSDAANYTCDVCNSMGCVKFTSKLEVFQRFPSRPYISEGYLYDRTVLLYSIVQFECKVVSDIEPYIEWFKTDYSPTDSYDERSKFPNGTMIQSTTTNRASPEMLQLHNVTFEDEGWYTCVASNSLGHSHKSAYLKVVPERVNLKPVITEAPKNQTIVYGHDCNYTCKYFSDFQSHLEWLVTYNDSRNKTMIKNTPFLGILQLHNVTFEDEGWYTCIASNSFGHSYASAYLKVVSG